MAKFFRLVKNEYIKTLKKVSTIIMLIIIVVCALGMSLMFMPVEYDFSYPGIIEEDNFNSTIQWFEDNKPDGYEKDIEFYKHLNEKGVAPDSWQADIAEKIMATVNDDQLFDVLDNVLDENGDWQKSCKVLLDNATTPAEKWEYKYRLDNDIPFGESWKDEVIGQVSTAKMMLEPGDESVRLTADEITEYEKEEKLGLYRLENNIEINAADAQSSLTMIEEPTEPNYWTAMFNSTSIISIIGLLMIIIAGSCVANEFSHGTIKFLLINPVKRWKILMAKYFTVISIGYIMLALLFVVMIPSAALFMGTDAISAPYLYVSDGVVHSISPFLQVIKLYLLDSINFVVMATMAFALSSLFKNSALAIGLGVAGMLAGNSIVSILALLRQDWARYLIFANTDLADIYNGESMFPQHSLTFALIVVAIHMVIFLLTAWDGFTKREV